MPWQESSPMSERLAFIQACLDRKKRIVDICSEFGISEKTGHKLLKRFREEGIEGIEGLEDRSHAGLTHPYRITPEVRERVIALRRRYPLYGAQMLRDWLIQHEPEVRWPAASSIGELLKRSNLIGRTRRRQRDEERAALDTGRTRALEPNMVWTADFKGEFRLKGGCGPYCYPLTALDLHSRFLLGCKALETTTVAPSPHSSLPDHRPPPGQFYTSSPRAYPTRLPPLVYPDSWAVRLVNSNGRIKWRNEEIFLSSNITGDYVGIVETEGDRFTISYGALELGHIEAESNRFTPEVRWTGLI